MHAEEGKRMDTRKVDPSTTFLGRAMSAFLANIIATAALKKGLQNCVSTLNFQHEPATFECLT